MEKTTQTQNNVAQYQGRIGGDAFKDLLFAGYRWLRANGDVVNALNVFPVPDGDTGTNMLLTMQAGVFEVSQLNEHHLGKIMQQFAHGALMGARGNSGVILSQIWRGFARALDVHGDLTVNNFSAALAEARDTAYRGVVRPVEGTILTVIKDAAESAARLAGETTDFVHFLEHVVEAADLSVKRTPDLLPVLKEAGVVDSGGKGLYYIFDGMLRYIRGESIEEGEKFIKPVSLAEFEDVMDEVEEGQDYEVIVDFQPFEELNLQTFCAGLEEMGTSIQVGEGDGLFRVHIHVPTENRYLPIDYAMKLGTITVVRMENLVAQMAEIEAKAAKKIDLTPLQESQIAVVAVSPGIGLSRVFASLGVHAIVSGGQTMNPSTKDLVAAFEDLPTDRVVLLPNNKNIILAAEAARDVSVKHVEVIPSRTIPQGLAAMLAFDPDGDLDSVVENMKSALGEVITGEITTATRTVEIDDVKVADGQIIALHNGKLVLAAADLLEGCLAFLEHAEAEDYELITMFYGENVTEEEARAIADEIQEKYPDHEVEVQNGGQAHYQFIFSIE